jgi:CubicO group peptidase (beta-lactamase class C family)
VVPQQWIEESFQPSISFSSRGGGAYGYQFWLWTDSLRGKPVKMVAAVGNGDQRIFIDQENKLLIVTTAGNYNLWNIKNNAQALFRRLYEAFP